LKPALNHRDGTPKDLQANTFMNWILFSLTALYALTVLLPMTSFKHYLIRGWDFPRLQLSVIGVVLIALYGVLFFAGFELSVIYILVILGCLLWQLWWIFPYTPCHRKEVQDAKTAHNNDHTLSIMTANVLQTNKNSQKLIDLVQQNKPDILVTLETNQWWEEHLAPLEKQLPYTAKCPLDNLYGMHVYSVIEFQDQHVQFLVQDKVPSIHCKILLNNRPIQLHFMHPAPPSPTENEKSLARDQELILLAKTIAKDRLPTVVAGDLNDVAWSPTTRLFRKISGLLDPRVGRGMFNTFHADYWFARWPLDHLFHSKHFTLKKVQRLTSIGSDHFPLLTSLVLQPQENTNNQSVDADAQDKQDVHELLEDNDVSESIKR